MLAQYGPLASPVPHVGIARQYVDDLAVSICLFLFAKCKEGRIHGRAGEDTAVRCPPLCMAI